jgi:DNA invertase Pin-like site-specific DNA recombinase
MATPRAKAAGAPETLDLAVLRRDYLASLTVLNAAAERVHQALDGAAAGLRVLRDHLQQDGRASDFTSVIEPIPLRGALSSSLTDLERARHRSQRMLFRLLQAEGTSISDIGRAWGISRQLVSRLINETD